MKYATCFIAVSLLLISASCVAPKKFQELQAQKAICDDKNAQLESENEGLKKQNQQHQELEEKQNSYIFKLRDTTEQLREEQHLLSTRYADLMKAQEALQTGSRQEIRKLLEQIQQNQEALLQKESELFNAERALNERTLAAQKLEEELSDRELAMKGMERSLNERNQKLIALQQALRQKDSVAQALRRKVADALLGFEGKGLTVAMRDGKVYVSLDEKLMFASGSSAVDARGAEAIGNLAKVLEQNPDINVAIEGHTDDVPYKGTGQLQDNWDLSVKRATSVVRIMLRNRGIEPSRVTAAGRAEFVPLQTGKTPEARQANRRIEVILAPKLDEVFKLLEN
ncbi:MAG: OmpA family protein [Prevotellaceae bacterium]|jgi:chemotaxis protein MotB|nr:OmpA family protein [Prevotellaceae bacterium]